MAGAGTHFAANNGRQKLVDLMESRKKQVQPAEPVLEESSLVVDLKRVVDRAKCGEPQPAEPVSVRLQRKFGGGADPRRRRELYRRLDLVVAAHGQEAIDVIGSVVADAVGKDKPGNYFCRAVIGRLRDRKLLTNTSGGDASW